MGDIPEAVQQQSAVVTPTPGPNGPAPHVPPAGGVDPTAFGQQVMGSISSSLEDWSSKAANVITKKTAEIFDGFEKRQAALKVSEEPTWQERTWNVSKFVGKTGLIFMVGLGFVKAAAVIIKGVAVGKAKVIINANGTSSTSSSTMPVTPTY